MTPLDSRLKYDGAIFDAHTHVVDSEALPLMVDIGNEYGVVKTSLIVHGNGIKAIENMYPNRFIFAKYFSGWILFAEAMDKIIPEVNRLEEQGYGAAKVHFAPFWIERLQGEKSVPPMNDEGYDQFFGTLSDLDIPVMIHVGDPDTYFATRYSDQAAFGTKEEHIEALEQRLDRSPKLRLQVAHFAAQPEPHRLDNLDRMLSTYKNLKIDTSSARWMSRELSKDTKRARDLFIKHSDRIMFGTDCLARGLERDYYDGRYLSLRLLLETEVRNVPLPFVDIDTVETGGTIINGLNLPERVLHRIYLENANKHYKID